jgi:hypothetical protein
MIGDKILKMTAPADSTENMRGADLGDQILSKFHTLMVQQNVLENIFLYYRCNYILHKIVNGKLDQIIQ